MKKIDEAERGYKKFPTIIEYVKESGNYSSYSRFAYLNILLLGMVYMALEIIGLVKGHMSLGVIFSSVGAVFAIDLTLQLAFPDMEKYALVRSILSIAVGITINNNIVLIVTGAASAIYGILTDSLSFLAIFYYLLMAFSTFSRRGKKVIQ